MKSLSYILASLILFQRLFGQTEGRVETRQFFSPALGITKQYTIYLPPGYDKGSDRYPVVYFFRGHEREWFNPTEDESRKGRTLRDVADSLISAKKIGKMILVGPSIMSTDNTVPGLGVNMAAPDSTPGIGTGKFEDYLTKDLIAHIDSTYRTIPDRTHRGVDGFSLGGYTAIMLAVKHPELFTSAACYDGTHMWKDMNDPRVDGSKDDATWMQPAMFDQAFGKPRDTVMMLSYNTANMLASADSSRLQQIRKVHFFIQSAAFDGQQGNIDRARHILDCLNAAGIKNGFAGVALDSAAVHNWHWANLHAAESLVKHWEVFSAGDETGRFMKPVHKMKKLLRRKR